MKRLFPVLLAALVILSVASGADAAAVYLFGFSNTYEAGLDLTTTTGEYAVGTSLHPINPLQPFNQGWWGDPDFNGTPNANYLVGNFDDHSFNDFFAFDLSEVTGEVLTARLSFNRGTGSGEAGDGSVQPVHYVLYDVSTDVADLLNLDASPNPAIYADLGSGASYGSYAVSTGGDPSELLSFSLNEDGVAAANEKVGGYFAIGGTLVAAPEPANFSLLAAGLAGIVAYHRRRK